MTSTQFAKSEYISIKNKIDSILKDWNVKVENVCDIKGEKGGYKVTIEVETTKSNEKKQLRYNVERNRGWADKIIIVCPNKKAKLEIEENLNDGNQGNLAILTYKQMGNLTDFFPRN